MPTSKYKIYLPESVKRSLFRDAELFEFCKHKGEVNLNSFIKTLISNYLEKHSERVERKRESIVAIIEESTGASRLAAETTSVKIMAQITGFESRRKEGNCVITLTVSGRTNDDIQYVIDTQLKGAALSQYLRNMFESYLSLPRPQREKIMFKETIETLERASKKGRLVSFRTQNAPAAVTVMPYKVVASHEESFNYLLCFDVEGRTARSYRISRICAPHILEGTHVMDESTLRELQRAEDQAPQFSFRDAQEACVRLTEEGKRKYRMIYTNRPKATFVDGDVYHFEWPLVQLEEYFKRFGEEAVILSPATSREVMREFYLRGTRAYEVCGDQEKRSPNEP